MKKWSISVAVVLLAGCGEPDVWNGWVYPDGSNLFVDIPIGEFESLELCRDAALSRLNDEKIYRDGQPVEGDYECGLNCEASGYGGNLCKETKR